MVFGYAQSTYPIVVSKYQTHLNMGTAYSFSPRENFGEVEERDAPNNEVTASSRVVICSETQSTSRICTVLNYCPNAPRFDITAAKNSCLFQRIFDCESGSGPIDIENKFNDIHKKLKQVHFNPYLWTIPLILVCAISFFALSFVGRYQVQCRTGKVCQLPTSLIGTQGECPKTDDWAIDCCYAFCDRKISSLNHSLDQRCFPDPILETKIRSNISVSLECYCEDCNSHESIRCRHNRGQTCGKTVLYGDFIHLPGFYASPNVIIPLRATCVVFIMILFLIGNLFTYCMESNIDTIIQEQFKDWEARGITVSYTPAMRRIGKRTREPRRLIFTLPNIKPTAIITPESDPPPPYPDDLPPDYSHVIRDI